MMDAAPLPHEEVLPLIRSAQGGDGLAMEELVRHNAALVKSIVKKYLGRGIEFDDLFQIGCLGLVKAIENYDEAFNVRFSTYAVPMIAGEIKRFLRDDGMIKVSRSIKELATRVAAAQERLRRTLGTDPGIQEIAREVEAEPRRVFDLNRLFQSGGCERPLLLALELGRFLKEPARDGELSRGRLTRVRRRGEQRSR